MNAENYRYEGFWMTNASTYGYLYGNNKQLLSRDLRRICKGNVFRGNSGQWSVVDKDESGLKYVVLEGYVRN